MPGLVWVSSSKIDFLKTHTTTVMAHLALGFGFKDVGKQRSDTNLRVRILPYKTLKP